MKMFWKAVQICVLPYIQGIQFSKWYCPAKIGLSGICVKVKQSHYTQWRNRGERRYSSSFMTSALDAGEWSASRPCHALPPGKELLVLTGHDAGWAPELVWTRRLEEKCSCLCWGSNLIYPVVQFVVRHYTDWATHAHLGFLYQEIFFHLPCVRMWRGCLTSNQCQS
jgi:hypothetical protein